MAVSFPASFLLLAVFWFVFCNGQVTWTATPFNPASIPLAVRSPYLSTWLPQGAGAALNNAWSSHWTGQITGWAGFVKVDGAAYSFLGAPAVPNANFAKAAQKSMQFTSTQTTFVMAAGAVDLNITFLSPVEPTDLVKQSFPFSYMAISASSTDGNAHSVQVYSDISAEWVSGDDSQLVKWNTTTGNTLIHQVELQTPITFAEVNDRIQSGSAFYATTAASGVTYQTGQDTVVRAQFINSTTLSNTQDTNFRAIGNDFPVFAFAHDLGQVSSAATTPVVVAVGHVRDPALQYIIANDQLQDRSSLFWNQFNDIQDAIPSFLGDYSAAVTRAAAFDAKVQKDASAISSDYADVAALSVRQALGSLEITLSKNPDGSFNTTDILVFLKEISSDGNVNTVDVVFPTYPLLLYANPLLAKYLLAGLFEYQATGQYPNKYSVHDLGSSYPNATGHNAGNDEAMPVEESGNMLIMALAYAQATGDNSQLKTYFDLLDQWTQFLVADSLIPANQISTDDFAGALANQTNLAIKGIVGIKAMSVIASIVGDSERSSNYSSIAASYVSQWQNFALSSDGSHLTLAYGDDSSWGLSYNLYGDKLLKLNLFPESIYQTQTNWYQTVQDTYGVPLDTRHTYTKSDWQLWTASIMTTANMRDNFVSAVRKFAADGLSSQPFGDWYDAVSGKPETFRARPVVGGHFALLAINTTGAFSSSSTSSGAGPNATFSASAAPTSANAAGHLRVPLPFVWLRLLFSLVFVW